MRLEASIVPELGLENVPEFLRRFHETPLDTVCWYAGERSARLRFFGVLLGVVADPRSEGREMDDELEAADLRSLGVLTRRYFREVWARPKKGASGGRTASQKHGIRLRILRFGVRELV